MQSTNVTENVSDG